MSDGWEFGFPSLGTWGSLVMCVATSRWPLGDTHRDAQHWLDTDILCINKTASLPLVWGIFDNSHVKLKASYSFCYLLFSAKWVRNLSPWIMLAIIVNLLLFIGSNKNVQGEAETLLFLAWSAISCGEKNMLICCKVLQEFSSQRNGGIKCILTRRSLGRETFIFIKSLNLLSSIAFFLQSAHSIRGEAGKLTLSQERPPHFQKEEEWGSSPTGKVSPSKPMNSNSDTHMGALLPPSKINKWGTDKFLPFLPARWFCKGLMADRFCKPTWSTISGDSGWEGFHPADVDPRRLTQAWIYTMVWAVLWSSFLYVCFLIKGSWSTQKCHKSTFLTITEGENSGSL